ncbi:FAD-binding oxidoreductase [Athalassotoga saccharophila]|uniref:FAD-binding oxidoreductase n=1 Tax=Athalassotoga saccharophila TaxID=1441386 RepID=UPI00137B18E5|nr:FAD-binding oxidoreductase [Athalassotoga saccharophila]
MNEFKKVDEKVVKELRQITSDASVIYEDKETLKNYSHDEAGGDYYAHMPDVVVKVENADQISKILKFANAQHIPVTPRGAGSGLAGANVPLYGGIVLSVEKMNRIIEIDKNNLVAVVEPGVVTNDLCKKVADAGLYYAGYPMSVETSFIGGNVATNAGGSKVIKYGNTGHHVIGLEVVMSDGQIVEFGGKRRKDSSGYDFIHLFVGSEGTLGVFSKIYLNLIPLPGKTVDLLAPFKDIETAISNVGRLMIESKTLPSAIEFIDGISVKLGSIYNNIKLPFQDEAGAYLLIQYEGRKKEEIEDLYEIGGKALMSGGAMDVFVADNRTNSEKLWRIRRNWLEGIKAFDPYAPTGDVVVPTDKIPQIMQYISEISVEYKVQIPVAGHAADGNVHPAPMKPKKINPLEWKDISEEILDKIALKAASLGGAISGEHGVGFIKKDLLKKTKPDQYVFMKKVKDIFDPTGIMNPGKLY